MKAIDQIKNIDQQICKNIDINFCNRGLLSQNILGHIRSLIEHSCVFIVYGNDNFSQCEIYKAIQNATKEIGNKNLKFRFLLRFHNFFQLSVSHYSHDENFSERLMLKYLECLIRLKKLFKNEYNIEILQNLHRFPRDIDKNLNIYYEKIQEKIQKFDLNNNKFNDRFYVWKVKPIFIHNDLIYEITLSNATDYVSKFQTFIVFSNFEIQSNYAIKAEIKKTKINIFNKKIPINLLISYAIDIRPCEFNNFAKIFDFYTNCGSKAETKRIREFMTKFSVNLLDIILFDDEKYGNFKNEINYDKIETKFLQILDKCRKICLKNLPGNNILRYLLYTMKNKVIKNQFSNNPCEKLSNLYLDWGCIPFDKMPFVSSMKGHNPKIYDLLSCINSENREYEFLANKIIKNTENFGILYTNKSEFYSFGDFNNILKLKNEFNEKLYLPKHENRKIMEWNGNFFIKGYEDDALQIIKFLKNLTKKGLENYENLANHYVEKTDIDDKYKKNILKNLFMNSKVALIYGAAGTGKSTLINHISNLFRKKTKIFLANTNPAVENLKMKIELANYKNTMTIEKFKNSKETCEILFIDECSTVSNKNMVDILKTDCFELLVLVGDNYQIESIRYGSWFDMARDFLSNTSVFELKNVFRTENKDLLKFWEEVRNFKKDDNQILEKDAFGKYSLNLDNSIEDIFKQRDDDEIVLCLNYCGLYGVNNLNTLLQIYNKNPSFILSNSEFKVDDPILFVENNFFISDLHNNLKGVIKKIENRENELYFEVLVDKVFDENHNFTFGLSLIKNLGNKSIVGFCVDKNINSDDDSESLKSVPFVLGYAVSIHKSQGLEYKSVKIIITQEIGEQITHNIFYTAITRAKEKLKIYWSAEVQKMVIDKFKIKNLKKDLSILKARKRI
ncbi:ATP-dependent RecD-like DNA helicase [Campylobacter ureolyticus]|uniref:ATP-dependent DNA helicase n=1 Tax=Campylobacter ureolyticus TaxID=827 RepID=UPI0022B2EE57|nr:ATP-dependent RecD-like DNA helicase [Campylobacter ureolyticus]MCZ6150522.1 ATP-dependent RecD-like DNA helicase [Campylobacter ureolyticus]